MITFIPTKLHNFLSLDCAGRAPMVVLKTAHIIRDGRNFLEGIDVCTGNTVRYPMNYFEEIKHSN